LDSAALGLECLHEQILTPGGMMNKFYKIILCVIFSSPALPVAFSQQTSAITAEKITENIYIVKGGVANTGFVIGAKEVVAIDAEMTADSAQKMIEEIKKVTPKPLTRLILTHSDADHVNGIVGFPKGLEIISSVVAKKEMADAFEEPNAQPMRLYLPTRTFSDKMDLDLGSERIQLIYLGPAHTSGDSLVFFPARKLAFVGDLVFIGRDPLIHRYKGGSSTGLIRTLQSLLVLNAEQYVPGHGAIVSKKEIEAELKSLQEKQEKIKGMIQEGKTLEEVKKAFGIATVPAKPGAMSFPSLVEVVYLDLSEKK
jgi:cyclase